MPREELRKLQRAHAGVVAQRLRGTCRLPAVLRCGGRRPPTTSRASRTRQFPFVVKQDMRDNYPFGMFAAPRERRCGRTSHASSGTTGQATVVGRTPPSDLANWGDCFARGICAVAATRIPPSRCPYGYGLFTGGLGAHAGGEAMGCTVIPTSSGNTAAR